MVTTGIVLTGVGGLLFAHLTILPVIHGRAALWYGREGLAATLALTGALATVWPFAVLTILGVVLIALFVGPWIAFGAPADAVASGARVAAGMVRARYEPQDSDRKVLLGGAATLRIVPLLPSVTVMLLTGKRTPKVRLWRNVFRKQVQNYVWRVA